MVYRQDIGSYFHLYGDNLMVNDAFSNLVLLNRLPHIVYIRMKPYSKIHFASSMYKWINEHVSVLSDIK